MKAALMCHQPATWTTALPLVLLGLRITIKSDLQTSPAELVYGEPLRAMSEFFCPSVVPENQDTFILQLYENLATVCPALGSRHTARKTFIYKDLKVASHYFLRTDSLRSLLQPPYTGPYQVISRTEKTYNLWINGKIVVVSVDRLKPAYMVSDMETCHQEPPLGSVPLAFNAPV
jgi:hypothetical protein